MNGKHILLWLEAPLQSWGSDSKFGRRDTMLFPTKSGILGIVLCALGASGEQKNLLARLGSLNQTVIAFARARKGLSGELEKNDREPPLRDFHMVGSGYDDQDPWETLLIPKKHDGKKAVGGGMKMTYRYYLQDATFAVILEVPLDFEETLKGALQNPVYDLYLGRKSCVPTEFIYQGVFDNEEAAVCHAVAIGNEKCLVEDFRVLEGEHEGEIMTLNDIPVHFGPQKKYRDRRVTVVYP